MPGIQKGFNFALEKGCLTGNKVSGVKMRLLDGTFYLSSSVNVQFIKFCLFVFFKAQTT